MIKKSKKQIAKSVQLKKEKLSEFLYELNQKKNNSNNRKTIEKELSTYLC